MNPSAPWDEAAASVSMARWHEVCEREQWGMLPRNQDLLRSLFGASWYLTRYLFRRGRPAAQSLDEAQRDFIAPPLYDNGEQAMEALRIARNDTLLGIAAADLSGAIDQETLEYRLTELARAVINSLFTQAWHEYPVLRDLTVLGLGRLAVHEMSYGSDLDLILLYTPHQSDNSGMMQSALRILRRCAVMSPAGVLYEIDTRLRPHGAAGVLLSPLPAFLDYYHAPRETWERQMMTRCHTVYGSAPELETALQDIIYAPNPDPAALAADIAAMRARIEHDLGSPRGRVELKRGPGGIMDIDFIAHFIQLCHGHAHASLRGAGTRSVLRALIQLDLPGAQHSDALLQGYDFLKRLESRLRIHEMRNTSTLGRAADTLRTMAHGMGFYAADADAKLLEQLAGHTHRIRTAFRDIVGPLPR